MPNAKSNPTLASLRGKPNKNGRTISVNRLASYIKSKIAKAGLSKTYGVMEDDDTIHIEWLESGESVIWYYSSKGQYSGDHDTAEVVNPSKGHDTVFKRNADADELVDELLPMLKVSRTGAGVTGTVVTLA